MSLSNEKVLLGLSGGADSGTAAGLLVRRGYEVAGVFLRMDRAGRGGALQSWSARHLRDAERTAETLGIELIVHDVGERFEPIIEYFAQEYAAGRTPNPCPHCNATIKLDEMLALADARGAGYVATGHHARIDRAGDSPALLRARNRGKDQSYALFMLPRAWLGRILLPIGELSGKAEVRRLARDLGLPTHRKAESQEICFLAGSDYAPLLAERAPEALRAGSVVDAEGNVLSAHDGYGRFTIGQRRGLRYAAGVPMYVTRIDPGRAEVTIGRREELLRRRLRAVRANWQHLPGEAFAATVQIRYNHPGADGTVRVGGDDTFEVEFDEPVAAVTPGQAAVVYQDQRLLGGGWIE